VESGIEYDSLFSVNPHYKGFYSRTLGNVKIWLRGSNSRFYSMKTNSFSQPFRLRPRPGRARQRTQANISSVGLGSWHSDRSVQPSARV